MDVYSLINHAIIKGEMVVAHELIVEVLKENPRDLQALVNLGIVFTEIGENEKAVKTLEYYLSIKEDNYEVHEALGCAFLRMQRLDDAEFEFGRAMDLAPENPSVMRNMAILYNHKDQNRKCAELLQRSYIINPHDFRTIYALAAVQQARGNYKAVELLLEELLSCDIPDDVRVNVKRRLLDVKEHIVEMVESD